MSAGTVRLHRYDEVRVARAGLLRCVEAPGLVMTAYVRAVGPEEAWARICAGTAPEIVQDSTESRTVGLDAEMLRRRAIGDLEWLADLGARLIVPEDEEWPDSAMATFGTLRDLSGGMVAPLGLYARGRRLPESQWGSVTVVGARASTPYGVRVAGEIASGLAETGAVVVSGGAFGIDAAAHRAALAVGAGPPSTIAVLANGIDSAYPPANSGLIDRVAESGTVLTEYPPGTTPARHRFLVRNRLIAALGEVTVVVEAGARSGSIATANAARRLNRVVAAVPGPVTSAMSVGCHRQIADHGAVLVTSSHDVLSLMAGADLAAQTVLPMRPTDALTGDTARVYEALPSRGSRSVERISTEAAVAPMVGLGALAELEVLGLAKRDGAYWKRVRATRG